MRKALRVFFLSGVLFAAGCSRPPEVPTIDKPKTEVFPEIALRDSLSPADFRQIFEIINQKGQLNGLKPWFQSASDSDLKLLGNSFSRYLYQEAFNPQGLPSLIENRIQQKSFSSLNTTLKNVSKNFPGFSLASLIQSTLNQSSFAKLIQRNSFVFDPNWNQNFAHFKVANVLSSISEEEASETLIDLKKGVESSSVEKEFVTLCEFLRDSELGKALFLSLRQLEEEHGEAVYADLGRLIKDNLKSTETSASPIQRLFRLTKILNQPTHGLFSKAQETLKTEEGEALVRLISERFDPIILKGAAGFIRETLKDPFDEVELNAKFWAELPRKDISDPPTENLIQLIRRLQFALDKMANSSRTFKDSSVTLNSFLLAEWFEQMAKENSEQIAHQNVENFKELFWQIPVKPFTFTLNLLELDEKGRPIKDSNGKYILAQRIEKELKALGMEDFSNDLKWAVKQDSFGATLTKLTLPTMGANLNETLKTVVIALHRAHPLADPVPFLSSLAYLFSRPSEGSPFTFTDLESPNMLVSVQNFLRGLSFAQLRKLVVFLFEDLEIGNISAEDRERLKSLYPNNPDLAGLLDSILQNLQIIYELDPHKPEGISLLQFYHAILSNSGIKDVKALSHFLVFLENTGLLDSSNSVGTYPSILKALSQETRVSDFLKAMGQSNQKQQAAMLQLLASLGGSQNSDITEMFSFLRQTLFKNTATFSTFLKLVKDDQLNFALSPEEQRWIYQFVNSDSFLDLYRILVEMNSAENLSLLVTEIESLQTNGDLENVIRILGNMKSDRMQRLALLMWQWEKSHELGSLFSLIKNLTKS